MTKILEIKSLGPEAEDRITKRIEDSMTRKKKDGILTDKEIREIEEMRLNPIPDLLDVLNVYENSLFRDE